MIGVLGLGEERDCRGALALWVLVLSGESDRHSVSEHGLYSRGSTREAACRETSMQ